MNYTPLIEMRSNNVLQGTLVRSLFRKNKHGGRAFRNVATDLWNGLPKYIREARSVANFKTLLKTFYFREHYGPNETTFS